MKRIPEMNLELKIGEEKFERNVSSDLEVDENDLDELLCNQASLYAYYSLYLQKATHERDQAQFLLEQITNKCIQTAREELDITTKRVTDKQIMAVVDSSDDVLRAKSEYIDAVYRRDQLYSLVRALEQKKDAIITLAYKKRSEIEALGSSVSRSRVPKSGIEDE